MKVSDLITFVLRTGELFSQVRTLALKFYSLSPLRGVILTELQADRDHEKFVPCTGRVIPGVPSKLGLNVSLSPTQESYSYKAVSLRLKDNLSPARRSYSKTQCFITMIFRGLSPHGELFRQAVTTTVAAFSLSLARESYS